MSQVVRLEQELAHFNLLSIRTTGQHIQSDDASQSDDESHIDGNPHPAAQPPLVANGLTLEVSTSWPTRIGISVRYAPGTISVSWFSSSTTACRLA